MSSTLLERTRYLSERIERVEQQLDSVIWDLPKNQKDNITRSHLVNHYLTELDHTAQELANIYEDKDGSRREELVGMAGQGPALFSQFYDRLRDIREYHRKFPNVIPDVPYTDLDTFEMPRFSGDEAYGRYLDLHDNFTQFINLDSSFKKPADYVAYLEDFHHLKDLQANKFGNSAYYGYLTNLHGYLGDFLSRAQPFFPLQERLAEHAHAFEQEWVRGEHKYWGRLNPLYCGACQKEFAKQTVFDGHLNGKKHLASAKREVLEMEQHKTACLLESQIFALGEVLVEVVGESQAQVVKKHSRTRREIEAEMYEEEQGHIEDVETILDEAEEEENVKMSIENYPVGWDGKPIPYWLYKLHGLGVEYKCEICGNTSYWGRKAFERHFQEWRHAHGMACLGIPNTRHFQDVTDIQGALTLYRKMKVDAFQRTFVPEQEEEYEDDEGNVFNKKTYDDLKRQGLL